MKRGFFTFILLALRISILQAQGPALERFFPPAIQATPTPRLSLPNILRIEQSWKVPVDQFNQAVRLNSDGIAALDRNDIPLAISFFSQACEINPFEPSLLRNLIIAYKKAGNRPDDLLKSAYRLLGMVPGDFHGAYTVGFTLMKYFRKPLESLPFLEMARNAHLDDPTVAATTAQAFEQAGFPEQALEILKLSAHQVKDDPFPMYQLGRLLMEKKDYIPAIRAFESALKFDREGYVHEILIRARFYSGQLQGLREFCKETLRRFPNVINKSVLERICRAISPLRVKFVETYQVGTSDAEALQKLSFRIRIIPQIPQLQKAILEKAEVFSGRKSMSVKGEAIDSQGRSKFEFPPEMFGPVMTLRLTYDLVSYPGTGSQAFSSGLPMPDLATFRKDFRFDLGHPVLNAIHATLQKMPGEFLQNACMTVCRGLTYVENQQNHDIAWIFKNPQNCDCTEYSVLLASLCLKNGNPARIISGFLLKPELREKETSIGHVWIEAFFPGKGWISVDPTLASTMHLAYFGNKLADQVIFGIQENVSEGRASIDYTSSKQQVQINLASFFRFSDERF